MRYIILILCLIAGITAVAQTAVPSFTAPVSYFTVTPTGTPSTKGSRFAIDNSTNRIYQWQPVTLSWNILPYGIDEISGCSAPAFTPGTFDSPFVINKCDTSRLYYYHTGAWHIVGDGAGGSGGGGSGTVTQFNFTDNNGFDGTVTNATTTPTLSLATTVTGILQGSGGALSAVTIGGGLTYGSGTLAAVDQSATNEIQTLSYSTPTVSLSNGGGSANLSDLNETVSGGTGITVNNVGQNYEVVNNAPDQTVTITGATGTYPTFALPLVAVAEGYGIDIAGTATRTVSVDTSQVATPYDITQLTLDGEVIGPISNNVLDTVQRVMFSRVPTAAGGVGVLRWNETDGTLDLGYKGGNVTLQIGQETTVRVVNKSGSTLTDGEVVYVSGAQGNRIAVRRAIADSDSMSNTVLGIVTETIPNNEEGYITTEGLVRGLNTSALTEGAPLYLSATTPGAITTTPPTGPDHNILVGYCVRQHATVGMIYAKVVDSGSLSSLSDVSVSSPTSGQALVYNGATWQSQSAGGDVSGVYSNLQIAADAITANEIATGAVGNTEIAAAAVTGAKMAQDGATSGQVWQWNGAAWAPATISGGSVPAGTSTQTLRYDGSNTLVATSALTNDGTTVAAADMNLSGTVSISGDITDALTASVNDYNPTGFATSSTVLISANDMWHITGMAGGTDGKVVTFQNTGDIPIVYPPENTASTAANRYAGKTDAVLYPGRSISWRYDATASRWRLLNYAGEFDLGYAPLVYKQFNAASITAADWGNFNLYVSGTGAANTASNASAANQYSSVACATGSTATGVAGVSYNKSSLPYWGANTYRKSRARVIAPSLSTGTDRFILYFRDNTSLTAGAIAVNTLGFRYSDDVNGGKWECFSRDIGGSETVLDSGVTFAINTIYDLEYVVNRQGAEARFFINGVYIGAITTNLPSTTAAYTSGVSIVKTVGATASSMRWLTGSIMYMN